ncbi:MAG TPA: glycosyltransferase family 39 protein, partial [Planctomycetota bacterium]|nr:glycosyltransferase family 39 protein [Planctomycetota bacterium]
GGGDRAARVWWLALGLFVAHAAINRWSAFEFHRDEFLYLAMGDHLQLWRMDFPPFIAIVANVTRALFGDSVVALRLGPALAGSLLVVLAARAAWLLGGSTAAQWLAAVGVATAPVMLRPGMLFQPVVFDQLWWTCALLSIVARQMTQNPKWWLGVGASLGLGLLTKFSIGFIGIGILVGTLATPLRRDLLTRWPWIALLLALAIGSPSLVGQVRLDFPISWQLRDLNEGQLARRSLLAFVAEQPLSVGPIGFVVAMIGLGWMLIGSKWCDTRAAAIAVVVSWLLLSLNRGKGYYGAPVYPLCLAAGALAIDSVSSARVRRIALASAGLLMAVLCAVSMPLVLPVLSFEATARYAQRLGAGDATRTNYGTSLPLPQDFADMLGWEALAQAVADEWHALPAADQARAVIGVDNYGEAGALDHYGRHMGFPPVVSGDGSYWFFGPGTRTGEVMLGVGLDPEQLKQAYGSCQQRRVVGSPWAVEEEQHVSIVLCRDPRTTMQAVWPSFHPGR